MTTQVAPSRGLSRPPCLCSLGPCVNADVIIDDPANSILLEVYGAELVPTTQFASEHTLRFPRVESVRVDKVRVRWQQ